MAHSLLTRQPLPKLFVSSQGKTQYLGNRINVYSNSMPPVMVAIRGVYIHTEYHIGVSFDGLVLFSSGYLA